MIATLVQGLPGAAAQAGAPAVTPEVSWGYLAPVPVMFGGALLLLLLRWILSWRPATSLRSERRRWDWPRWPPHPVVDASSTPPEACLGLAGAVGVDGLLRLLYWVIAGAVVLAALLFHGYLARET
ncbi:MAG: hypothetical protein R2704_12850 [Microthrixaceae bacterium]